MELNMPQIVLTAMTIIAIYFAISSFNKGRKNLKYQKKIHFLDELYTIANNHKSYVGSGGEGDKELFLTINSMSFEELESISDHLEFYIYHFTLSCRHLRTFFEAQTKWIKDKKKRIYLTDIFNQIIHRSDGENLSGIYLSGLESMFNNKLEFKFKEEMDGVVNHAEHRIDSVRKKFCENVNSKFDELISTPETGVDEIALLKREKIRFNLKFPEYAQNKELTQ